MTSDSANISDISGNMSEVTSTRSGRKRKSMCFMNDKKGEVSSIGRGNVAENEVFADAVTQVGQNLIVDSEIVSSSASGQAMYQKSKGDVIDYNDDGDDEYQCNHCDANFWYGEAKKRQSKRAPIIYTGCQKGRVRLEQLKPTPLLLEQHLNPNNGRESVFFRENIRVYNSMFAYTSMGAKIDYSVNDGSALYVFKICGQIHHLMDSMLPQDGEYPTYAQLYIYDTRNKILNRVNIVDRSNTMKVKSTIIATLNKIFDELNELTKMCRTVRDRFESNSLPSLNMTMLAPELKINWNHEMIVRNIHPDPDTDESIEVHGESSALGEEPVSSTSTKSSEKKRAA